MPIALGLSDITAIAIGDTPVVRVHLGNDQVWPSAPPALINLTYFGSQSGTFGTIPYPAGVQAGDVAVFLENMPVGAVKRIPPNYTELYDINMSNNNGRLESSYRILTSGDIGGGVALAGVAGILTVYRGFDATETIPVPIGGITTDRMVFNGSTTVFVPAITITPKAVDKLSQSLACYASGDSIGTRVYSGGTIDRELSAGTNLYTKQRSYKNAIASNITVDMQGLTAGYNLICAFDITAS